jgi:hypothetical protein
MTATFTGGVTQSSTSPGGGYKIYTVTATSNTSLNGDILLKTAEVIPMHSAPEEGRHPTPLGPLTLTPFTYGRTGTKPFTKEECEKIIEIGKDRTAKEATTRGENTGARKSEIAWLYPSDDLGLVLIAA